MVQRKLRAPWRPCLWPVNERREDCSMRASPEGLFMNVLINGLIKWRGEKMERPQSGLCNLWQRGKREGSEDQWVKFRVATEVTGCEAKWTRAIQKFSPIHVSNGPESAHLLESIEFHHSRFVKVLRNKTSRAQSIGPSLRDLWKINPDIYPSTTSWRKE